MEFSEACAEVDFILANLNPEDKKKIPETTINFFKENKSLFYKVNLTTSKPLSKQNLKDETKAFIQILNYKYFSSQEQKEEFMKMLKENEHVEEEVLNETSVNKLNEKNAQPKKNIVLVVYKENKIKAFIKKIRNFFIR